MNTPIQEKEDSFEEYERVNREKTTKSEQLIDELLLRNKKLESSINYLNIEKQQLIDSNLILEKKNNDDLKNLELLKNNDLILKDFLEHFLNLRIHSNTCIKEGDNDGDNSNNEIVIDVSHANIEKTMIMDYKLIMKSSIDSEENTTVIYIPLLKYRTNHDLAQLKEKLPEYMFETIQFPLSSLSKFYTKLNKYLNK